MTGDSLPTKKGAAMAAPFFVGGSTAFFVHLVLAYFFSNYPTL
jgi:hypothetical protein